MLLQVYLRKTCLRYFMCIGLLWLILLINQHKQFLSSNNKPVFFKNFSIQTLLRQTGLFINYFEILFYWMAWTSFHGESIQKQVILKFLFILIPISPGIPDMLKILTWFMKVINSKCMTGTWNFFSEQMRRLNCELHSKFNFIIFNNLKSGFPCIKFLSVNAQKSLDSSMKHFKVCTKNHKTN